MSQMNKISFWSNRPANNNSTTPVTAKKVMPQWFLDAKKYWKNEEGKEYIIAEGEKGLGFKSCPALLDLFNCGYMLVTPCDVVVYMQEGKKLIVSSPEFPDFCEARPYMNEFNYPYGYSTDSFHWFPSWGFDLPKGYSALIVHPLNRYDLPFLTTNGIIDSDKYGSPGLMPFFIREDFVGVIPKGTPFAQIIPFKREDWKAEYNFIELEDMIKRHEETVKKYRVPFGGIYKRFTWVQKKYE
jgi:hypothetical protein